MTVVIAPDSFKGCLSAPQAAQAIATGIRRAVPDADIRLFPMADGGEGTACAVAQASGARRVEADTLDPLLRPIRATYYLSGKRSEALIDIASASGLALLAPGERSPAAASSFGSGLLMADAVRRGARRLVVGLGGSATIDCGAPMLQALGARFFAGSGKEFTSPLRGIDLKEISGFDITRAERLLEGCEIVLLCDVMTPLVGNGDDGGGAVEIFGPQKGLGSGDIGPYKAAVGHFASLVEERAGGVSEKPMTGAAGGISAGLGLLQGVSLRRGAPFVIETVGAEEAIRIADIVITGEGSSDSQTLMGKLPSEILACAKRANVAAYLLSGRIADREKLLRAGFSAATDINEGEAPADVLEPAVASSRLSRAAFRLVSSL